MAIARLLWSHSVHIIRRFHYSIYPMRSNHQCVYSYTYMYSIILHQQMHNTISIGVYYMHMLPPSQNLNYSHVHSSTC